MQSLIRRYSPCGIAIIILIFRAILRQELSYRDKHHLLHINLLKQLIVFFNILFLLKYSKVYMDKSKKNVL